VAIRDEEPWDLFVSYAHADDHDGWITALVELLQKLRGRHRRAEPWHIFFDRDAIRTMDDWERRIGGALRSAGVLLAVLSPAYFASPWCRREWEEFRTQEKRQQPEDRIAALYLESDPDYETPSGLDDWRGDLRRRQHLDLRGWRKRRRPHGLWEPLKSLVGSFRSSSALPDDPKLVALLEKLVGDVSDQLLVRAVISGSRRPGVPFQAPPLPGSFVARPEDLERLREGLLAEDSSVLVISAVHGLPGVGKSTLAAALAADRQVEDRFADGVLWVTLGQQPDVLSLLSGWVQALGDREFRATHVQATSNHLRSLLHERRVLLVIDDAWQAEHAAPFVVGGPGSRVLITTREAAVARGVGAHLFDLDVLSSEQALGLLSRCLGRELTGPERDEAVALAREVGYLPLALELAAVQIHDDRTWDPLLRELRQEIARLERLNIPGGDEATEEGTRKRLSLTASLRLSLRRLSPELRRRFAWLGVLAEDVRIHQTMAATLWNTTEEVARESLTSLAYKALLQAGTPDAGGSPTYRLHDLLHDEARWLLTASPADDWPGLGVPLPQAHRELLGAYQRCNTTGHWHTVVPDGYIHDHLAWHLEKGEGPEAVFALLGEETSEGRNGWFEACSRQGRLAGYANDVARAWGLAEQLGEAGGHARSGSLAGRYALITATLGSLASNLPPEMLAALAREGVWPLEQALAHARRQPDPRDRAASLLALVPLAPAHVSVDLRAEAERADPSGKGPNPSRDPSAEKSEWLPDPASWRVPDFKTLAGEVLAACSVEEREAFLAAALRAARNFHGDYDRIHALAVLAPHLPEAEKAAVLLEMLQAARAVRFAGLRARALMSLAPHVAESERAAVLSEALEAARNEEHRASYGDALAALAAHLSPDLLAEAFHDLRHLRGEASRGEALVDLAPHLPGDLLDKALTDVRGFSDEGLLARVLIALVPRAASAENPSLLGRVIDLAWNINDHEARARAFVALASRVPEERREWVLSRSLSTVLTLSEEGKKARTLVLLAPWLSGKFLAQAVDIASKVERPAFRARALAALAERSSEAERSRLLADALDAARYIPGERERRWVLAALVPRISHDLLDGAVREVPRFSDESDRAAVLSKLAPRIAEAEQPPLLAEAIRLAWNLGSAAVREPILAALTPRTAAHPPTLLAEMLRLAQNIGDEGAVALALAALVPHLPAEHRFSLLIEALAAVSHIIYVGGRARALLTLAPHLPGEQRRAVLTAALSNARAIRAEPERAEVLAGLSPYLADHLLTEGRDATLALIHHEHRVRVLAALLPVFPVKDRPPLVAAGLRAVQDIKDTRARGRALVTLAPVLLPEFLDEAHRISHRVSYNEDQAVVLVALAASAPSWRRQKLLDEARNAASGTLFVTARARSLAALAPHTGEAERAALVSQAMENVPNIPTEPDRAEVLTTLAPLLPDSGVSWALELARGLGDPCARGAALSALAPRVGEDERTGVLREALHAASTISAERDRARTLAAVAVQTPGLSPDSLRLLWSDALHQSAQRKRADLLGDLAALTPLLAALGGSTGVLELAGAIRDVSRWWP
jgi:hypothetical protein